MINAIKNVWSEHKNNLKIIWKMARISVKKQTINTSLGFGWTIIRDIVYFAAFIAFRYAMSGGRDINGVNFVAYLFAGLVPWFFINDALVVGGNAIKLNAQIIKSIRFPITILPTIETLSIIIKRLFTLAILYLVTSLLGYFGNLNPLLLIYYFIALVVLMESIVLCFSGFIAVSKDFNQLYMAITRIIFFTLPVIWSYEQINQWPKIVAIVKLNPMVYVIMGFRDAFLLGNMPNLYDSIYFWIACLVLMQIGTSVQHKLRKYYADFL